MKITFEKETEIVLVPELKVLITEVLINQVIDYPEQKLVEAYTQELGIIALWKGAEYDAVGQWTDADVVARIKELYK